MLTQRLARCCLPDVGFVGWKLLSACPLLTQFRSKQYSEYVKEPIADSLSVQCFSRPQNCLILQHVGLGLHLKSIRIHPPIPEPVC